jgi:hypothetical protein
MPFTRRTQYLLVNAAVITASAIQLVRHKPLVIVIIAALTFFAAGNLTVYLGGSKQRAIDKQRKIDNYRN